MSYTLYAHLRCSTCKKAVQFLQKHHIEHTVKDIQLSPPSLQELEKMAEHKHFEIKKLFNTSGMLYRSLQLNQTLSSLSTHEALLLLSKHPMLIKRPFLLLEDQGLVGFKEKEWQSAFHSQSDSK